MSLAINVSVELETRECYKCGIVFGAPVFFMAQRHKDHSLSFYCPAGHSAVFVGETEAQKYKRLFEDKERALKWSEEVKERQARLLKKTTTQLNNTRKRIANGVCPCCHRTVKQMARHMATKHPDYETQDIGK